MKLWEELIESCQVNICWSRQQSQSWFRVPSESVIVFLLFSVIYIFRNGPFSLTKKRGLNATGHCPSMAGDSSEDS
jgi:hypothetical protein